MAIFHLSTKIIKRSDGRSSVGASAYRSASKMIDNRTGKSFNYTKKRGVIETGCMMRDAGALIDIDRAELWNVAERVEKRKDSRTAREFVMALPHELDHSARKDIVERFCRQLIDRYGVAVDWAMHAPDRKGDDKNYHAHILMTTRTASITNDGMILLGEKTDLELANKDLKKRGVYISTQQQIKDLREFCATITNNALKDAKIDASVDHRSHKDRNLKTVPTIKLGFKASSLERQGITTERGDINRAIRAYNDALNAPVPAPKPKPAPKPASAPVVHHAPAQPAITPQFLDDFANAFAEELANEPVSFAFDKMVEPAPAPPPPPKPVVISLPLTASYIPGGYNRPLFQQPTVAVGHYKGCKEFQSGNVRMGQVDIDLSTMQIINETISKHYPSEYHDDFSRLVRNNAYAFLGRDDKGNEKMGFDKYNEHLKQYHRTSFQCDQSFHGDINKAFDYLQRTPPQVQQMQRQARQEHENSYDFSR